MIPETTPELHELAEAHGIQTEHWSFFGERVTVPDTTLRALLTALGVAAETPAQVTAALRERQLAPWRKLLPPSIVARLSAAADGGTVAPPMLDHTVHARVRDGHDVRLWITLESGERREVPIPAQQPESFDLGEPPGGATEAGGAAEAGGDAESGRDAGVGRIWRVRVPLPHDLPPGWHTLHACESLGGVTSREAEAVLAIAPHRLTALPATPEHDGRGWGLMAQLYSVRSRGSWGMGDLADLADLAAIAGGRGADFVLLNPLHAGDTVSPIEPSPYFPSSRRFFSPLYLRPEHILEFARLDEAARATVTAAREATGGAGEAGGVGRAERAGRSDRFGRATNETDETERIDRDTSWAAKRAALELVFAAGLSPAREAQFNAFVAREGAELREFAEWNAERDGSPAQFHLWLQWVLDEQLAHAQAAALASGMRIGIMHDLAVGVDPGGFDASGAAGVAATGAATPAQYLRGVTVGAPPDQYNAVGQNWNQPAYHPAALAENGYAALRQVLRAQLRHAGALRIDHVMGLFRLWCVPAGAAAAEGAYLRYDHEAMLGVLTLEAHRAGAVVIGEDLGTVEPWVRDALRDRGVLGTSVLWFERDGEGLLSPEHYRSEVIATVTTHDLPPTASYLAGNEARELLAATPGILAPPTVESLHRWLASSPARLIGVALADAVGERRTQNVPGTHREHPNWQVPLGGPGGEAILLDDLATNERFLTLTATVDQALRAGTAEPGGLRPVAGEGSGHL